MDTFDRITALLRQNNMTQADLSRATGISTGLISQWKKRMQSPSTEKLKLIADHFNVTVDYLLGNEQKGKAAPDKDDKTIFLDDTFNENIIMIARAGKKMTNAQAENLRKYAQYMYPEAFEDDN